MSQNYYVIKNEKGLYWCGMAMQWSKNKFDLIGWGHVRLFHLRENAESTNNYHKLEGKIVKIKITIEELEE